MAYTKVALESGVNTNAQNKQTYFSDVNGRLHFFYPKTDGGVNKIRHAFSDNNGTSWTYEWATPATGWATMVYCAACSDTSGNLHLVYGGRTTTNNFNNAKYVMFTAGGAWDASETYLTDVAYATANQAPSIAVDSVDNVYVAYFKNDGSYTKPYSKKKTSGTWGSEYAIDTSNSTYTGIQLLINSTNEYCLYGVSGTGWKWKSWSGSAWDAISTPLDSTYGGTSSNTATCADNNGDFHLVSHTGSGQSYSKWTTSWSDRADNVAAAGTTGNIHIQVNKANEIYEFWRHDDGTKHLYLTKYVSSWADSAVETIDPAYMIYQSTYYPLTTAATPANMPKTGSTFICNSYHYKEDLTWDVNPATGAAFIQKVVMF